VLSDIASFRALTDDGLVGALWRVGDSASLQAALDRVLSQPLDVQSRAARALFERRFSWVAIGRRAVEIYRRISRA
jgi:glycosyltransferase involved in cell wall biosynthesis